MAFNLSRKYSQSNLSPAARRHGKPRLEDKREGEGEGGDNGQRKALCNCGAASAPSGLGITENAANACEGRVHLCALESSTADFIAAEEALFHLLNGIVEGVCDAHLIGAAEAKLGRA